MAENTPIKDWQGKRVWLVGASTGIGAALAASLAQAGARLVLSARNAERLASVSEQVAGSIPVVLDISESAQWQPAYEQVRAALGGLDVVILNAGTYSATRAWELQIETARMAVETNVMGIYNGLAATLPGLLAQESGHVVIVASVAGYSGLPKAICYGPTKAALINLAECLYLDLAPKGIGVSVVNPGFVATPLTAQNDFKMPALISAEEAAHQIMRGLARGEFEIHFPKRFSRALKFLRLLPYSLYFRLVGKGTGA